MTFAVLPLAVVTTAVGVVPGSPTVLQVLAPFTLVVGSVLVEVGSESTELVVLPTASVQLAHLDALLAHDLGDSGGCQSERTRRGIRVNIKVTQIITAPLTRRLRESDRQGTVAVALVQGPFALVHAPILFAKVRALAYRSRSWWSESYHNQREWPSSTH